MTTSSSKHTSIVVAPSIAIYISKQIHNLKGVKTQREIAAEVGYDKPNMISMLKTGDTKVPLEKIPLLAKALNVDPAHLFRLALEQYWPGLTSTIAEIFGTLATSNEESIFLTKWRAATGNTDPAPNARIDAAMDRMLDEAA
jgi:transcriptional regulator with XRE-family HTH domain